MSKYCPEWIFGVFAAQTSKEFLSSNNSIAGISRKYAIPLLEYLDKIQFTKVSNISFYIVKYAFERFVELIITKFLMLNIY